MKIKYLALALFFINSCAPVIKNFDKYEKQFINKTSFMPTKENLENKSPKIVVFALDENNNEIATQSGLGVSIANNIENTLSQNKLAQLVDRNANIKLQKEIQLAELKKTGSYKGPIVADYAISGAIANASFASKYSSGSTFYNPKTNQLISVPPKFTYTSEVSGNVKIYELPSLTVIETIEFLGKESRKENVQQDGGFSFGALKIGGKSVEGTKRDDGLVRKAGEDAIDNAKIAIKNAFAKKGYIMEKRSYKNKSIFKISLGSSDGVRQGDKFDVIGKYETENPLNGEIEIERRIIASGIVSNLINDKTCWILIDDKNKINNIRLGDMIKIKYKRGSLETIMKYGKDMANL